MRELTIQDDRNCRLTVPLCEPVTMENKVILYKREFPEKSISLSLRLLSIGSDIHQIHEWVNQEYAKRFWQLDGQPISNLIQTYEYIQSSDYAQSYITLLNDKPVGQIDLYHALHDEVGKLYEAEGGDYGLHLLMAPPKTRIPQLTICVFQTFLEYLFSFPEVNRVIGEPDADNHQANTLVRKLGFQFQKRIKMSYKTANLYFCTRESFEKAMNTHMLNQKLPMRSNSL
ncbi:MAG TPA: GNAT family N-acetyltransferase [Chitinophagaceae bacterium]